MADADNLDALSNAELRAQMIAQGLPNIPVTDSSRKVLVKRLRASLGGNAALPAASGSPKSKPSNRRETLQPATAAAAAQQDKMDANVPPKARRTIAAALVGDSKEEERRAKTATVAPVKAAPIQSRRASNTERREVVNVVKKPETIAEETPPTTTTATATKTTTAKPAAVAAAAKPAAAVPKQGSGVNTLEVNSLIILESDDEEDEQLALAAQSAEDQARHKEPEKPTKPRQLTATTTSTHSYVSKPLYQLPDPPVLQPQRANVQLTRPTVSSGYEYGNFGATTDSSSTLTSRTGRYTSYASSTAPSYSTAASSAAAAAAVAAAAPSSSSYRRSPPRTYAHEFSDDTAEDEEVGESALGVRYESDFARKLAKLRAERIGDRSSSYSRRTIAATSSSSYEPVARRSLRPESSVSVSLAFRRWAQSLDRKYNLKGKLFLLFVLLLLYLVYKFNY
ncbi:hypothetical protein KR222_000844 [Zaprionus bogoriensis]|nr:hypothetical protein KR222_000844 [Zaprionus bogoriensis]